LCVRVYPLSGCIRLFACKKRPPPASPLFPYTTLFRSALSFGEGGDLDDDTFEDAADDGSDLGGHGLGDVGDDHAAHDVDDDLGHADDHDLDDVLGHHLGDHDVDDGLDHHLDAVDDHGLHHPHDGPGLHADAVDDDLASADPDDRDLGSLRPAARRPPPTAATPTRPTP